MSKFNFNLTPTTVPKVDTKYRKIVTPLPVPESLEIMYPFSSEVQSFPITVSSNTITNTESTIHIVENLPKEGTLYQYDENETDLKYSALKAENIFKYQNTFKAIRWGVTVGGLFAMHRYYRSRDLSSSVNWFCTVSSANFFLIWVSYGLQDFVTQRGTSKSIQDAARNEYHTNAYK